MGTPRVLFTCQNKQEAQSLLHVADQLSNLADSNIAIDFLSQDAIFAQDVESVLQEAGKQPKRLELPFCLREPYPVVPRHVKALTLHHLKKSLTAEVHKYDAIVSGIDGLPVRILADEASDQEIPMFQLVVSLHDHNPDSGRSVMDRLRRIGNQIPKAVLRQIPGYGFLSHPSRPGGSHSGPLFVSGERVKQSLVQQGVAEDRIEVTGIPRFKPLYRERGDTEFVDSSDDIEILYLPSAFKLHGYQKLHQLQQRQVEYLVTNLRDRASDARLVLKPHPREDSGKYDKFDEYKQVSVIDVDSDIYEVMRSSDVVVTVVSTAAYEAALLRRPVILGRFPESDAFGKWTMADDFPVATSTEDFFETIRKIATENTTYSSLVEQSLAGAKKVIDPATPDSDTIIANRIYSAVRT